MNWSRNKKFSEEKAVNGEIYCILSFGGGKFKQWIGIETRTLGKRRLWMEKSIACWALGGNLNNELESRHELFSRERCESRNTIACWALGEFKQWIGVETRTLRKRKLWMEKSIACSALGGKFKQWIGIVTRTLQQRKLWIQKYYCMLGLGLGGKFK